MEELSRRAYSRLSSAWDWEEVWEAGPYYEQVSKCLEEAREYVIFLGWQLDSRLPLPLLGSPAGAAHEPFKRKILRLCEEKPGLQFYFLIWKHAAVYIPERESWQGRIWEDIHPRVHFIFDNCHALGGSHHEKIVIVDGETAFCGGIDLCGDRWDSPGHLYEDRRRSFDWKRESHGPYHDLAVRVRGPVCAELQRHARERWQAVSEVPFPEPRVCGAPPGGSRVYLSRTWLPPEGRPIREIEFLYAELLRSARRSILIEGQYFWSRKILDLLVAKLRETRGTSFALTLILADLESTRSLTRRMADYEQRLIEQLERSARFYGARLELGTPYVLPPAGAPGGKARSVYVHSKLLLVDDRWLSIGSANLAARALRLDTEVNLTLEARSDEERAHLRAVAQRVREHWNLCAERDRDGARVEAAHVNPALHLRGFDARATPPSRPRAPGELLRKDSIFDPARPWLAPLRQGFFRLAARAPEARLFAAALVLAWSVALALSVSRAWSLLPGRPWLLVDAALLCSSWLVELPFLWLALFTTLSLGPSHGPALLVASLWAASTAGYLYGRGFPAEARRLYALERQEAYQRWMGWRSFGALLDSLFRPGVTLRSKIGFQGIYFVPLPWFVLANWVIVPSVAYTLSWALAVHGPPVLAGSAQDHPAIWVAVPIAGALLRQAITTTWKSTGSRSFPTTSTRASR